MSATNEPVVLNPVVVNDELTKTIRDSIDPEQIKAAILAEAAKQTTAAQATAAAQAEADRVGAEKKAAETTAPQEFSRVENIGGKDFTFTGSSEAEVERLVLNAYRVAYAVREPGQQVETVDPSAAAAAAQQEADAKVAARAAIEARFKLGEISASDFIKQSGAMDEYLAEQGIPVSALKAAVERNQSTEFEHSWAQATEEFKNSPAGADWPGGEKNKAQMGLMIASLNLVDATDRVGALTRAYEEMKKTGLIFPVDAPVVPAVDPAKNVTLVETAKPAATVAPTNTAAPVKKDAPTSSTLFGRSSGTAGASPVDTKDTTKSAVDIPATASPAEILAAYNAALVASGKNPDAEFQAQFSNRRA